MNPVSPKSVGILKNAMRLYVFSSVMLIALAVYFVFQHVFKSAVICALGAMIVFGAAYLAHKWLAKNQTSLK